MLCSRSVLVPVMLFALVLSGCGEEAARDVKGKGPHAPDAGMTDAGESSPIPEPEPTQPEPDAGTEVPATPWIWGVTIDNPWKTAATVDALSGLSTRVTARVVFDEHVPASEYLDPVTKISQVADVMGEILDSYYVPTETVAGYEARTRDFVDTLGSRVSIWEIGNEINGEWLGPTADVVAKMTAAYRLVESRGLRSALTLYYNENCWERPEHEMFAWTQANVPAEMRQGLDYVWISYYEDDCNGLQPDWDAVFQKLATIFPNSAIGFGEVGTLNSARKSAYLNRYYTLQVNAPRFVGGYFWWYFSQDMVPSTKPLWGELNTLVSQPRP